MPSADDDHGVHALRQFGRGGADLLRVIAYGIFDLQIGGLFPQRGHAAVEIVPFLGGLGQHGKTGEMIQLFRLPCVGHHQSAIAGPAADALHFRVGAVPHHHHLITQIGPHAGQALRLFDEGAGGVDDLKAQSGGMVVSLRPHAVGTDEQNFARAVLRSFHRADAGSQGAQFLFVMDQRPQGIYMSVSGGGSFRQIHRPADAETKAAVFYQDQFHY